MAHSGLLQSSGSDKATMKDVSLQDLLEAGVHFGHKTTRWHPKAGQFIYKAVGDTHIIDLVKTKEALDKAADFIEKSAAEGKEILFIGTKRQARGILREAAEKAGAPFVDERWIGGLLTNWEEIKKNIDKLLQKRALLKDEEKLQEYTKRERLEIEREEKKLATIYEGVSKLKKTPDVLFVVDVKNEATAVREALRRHLPIVGIVDTNADPSPLDYPIPANDDAVGSVKLILEHLLAKYAQGKSKVKKTVEKE